ncbi:MAG: AAA family ATPase, partial [Candidatus Atribacteria bacterium]
RIRETMAQAESLQEKISMKVENSLKQKIYLPFYHLAHLFQLTRFEMDIILVCLAPELDVKYEKLYAYLQDDVTKKRPTFDLVMRLLCYSLEENFGARKYFLQTAPLMRNRLLSFVGDEQLPLLSRSLKIDERIISFLLGADGMDKRIQKFTDFIEPRRSFDDMILAEDHKTTLNEFAGSLSSNKSRVMLFFHGPYGTGKKMIAEAICRELGAPLLVVDSKGLQGSESLETLNLIFREAMLQDSSLYFEDFDVLLDKDAGVSVPDLIRYMDSFPVLIFLSGGIPFEPKGRLTNHSFIRFDFPIPSFTLRKELWKSSLNGIISDADIDALAGKFKFSGGQMKDAIFTAQNAASAKGRSGLSMEDLYIGCRLQSNSNLSSLARKIEPHYAWEDIVLPTDTKKQLEEVAGYVKYRGVVYSDWGFDRKLSIGKGLNVLFSGPSGTGKTMAAEIIAREVQLDIYKIDLSNVVSKYIGETEKNLSRIFREAETSNSILFFDEADALFGKRSEVKDAHDRYANIETGYLLQKMEEYDGIVILATNLSKNIDDAFMRRMQIVIEFPFPDDTQRRLIWSGMFPKESPLGEDIDYRFLSQKIKLAGGNIKNMALAAAFYAAENSREINMHHIMHAARREYQKMGKPFLKADFEPYYEQIKAGQ